MKNLYKLFFLFFLFQLSIVSKSQAQSCQEDPCQGATYDQNQWGQSGCHSPEYLSDNFSSAFPNGLVIGCGSKILKLTSTSAVSAFLPSSGTAAALPTGTLTNPGSTYKNTLAGHLVALTLNMIFDQKDPNFSPSAIALTHYTITSGTFSGMTVGTFLNLANSIIGGCSSQYSYSQLSTAASNINDAYKNGNNTGFLKCGGECTVNVSANYSAIACKGGMTTVTVTASGGKSPYTGTGTYTAIAGSRTFTVLDAYGCPAAKTINITQPSQQLTASSTAGAITCNGGSANINVTASGGTSPYTGTGTFSKPAGAYSFTVTDNKGCKAVTSQTLAQPAPLVASAAAGTISCFGGSTTITITATGGTQPCVSGTGVFTKSAGAHSFTVTDTKGCKAVVTVTLTQPSSQLSASASVGTIACFGSSALVTISASGGTAPYTGTGTFSRTAGTHTFTITDARGCSVTISRTITQPSKLNASSSWCGAISCYGGSETINVSASGGTAPYSGTGSFTRPAGAHTFTVTDAKGCTATTSETLTQPNPFNVNAVPGIINCFGGSTNVTVTASGGSAPYSGTGTFSKPAGVYTFTVTDNKGCTSVKTITITQPAQLSASAITTSASCSGGSASITVSATGGTAPYTGTGTFTRSSGVHSFTVTDAKGCTTVKTVTITQPAALNISVTTGSISCFGGSANVTVAATGGSAPYSGTGIFAKTAGVHSFTVSDAAGCSGVATKTIAQPTQLVASAISCGTLSCNGGATTISVTASGGTAPYSGTGVFSKTAGVHSFTVTDTKGCTSVITHTIYQPEQFNVTATAGNINCFGGVATVTVSANGGSAPYNGTGTFTTPAGVHIFTVTDTKGCMAVTTATITQPVQLTASAVKGSISGFGGTTTVVISATGGTMPYTGTGTFIASAGTHTYVVTDANGCSVTLTVTLTEPGQLVGSATQGTILCNGGTTTVNITATGGVAPYSGVGIFTASAGTHTYLVTDSNGNSTIVTVVMTQPSQLIASATSGSILCNGGTTTVNVTATGGVGPYTGTGLFTVGAGTYTYLVTDANGCSTTASIVVTEPAQLAASATTGTISGFGGTTTVVINANGGTTPYSGTGTFTASSGTHTYLVTDANGCSVTLTVTLTEPGQLVGSATQGTIFCNGGTTTVNITATGGVAPYNGTGTFTASAGTHTYLVTDSNGNSTIVTVVLTQPSQLIASATSGSILCNGGTTTVNVTATGGIGPYTGTSLFTVGTGTYTYLVTDANGCSATTSIVVTEPTPLIASATTGTISGFGGTTTVVISATGGTMPYSGTGTFTASSGTHTYLVTDANGCSVTLTVTLTEPGQLVGSATQGTILCNGGTTTVNITATGGVAPYSGVGIFTASAGTHTYLVTDSNGNSTIVTVVLTQPSQLIASATSGSILCNGGTTTVNVTATGGVGPYTGTGLFTVGAGTYTYLVTDANGCSTTASIVVTEPAQLTASATAGTISGFGGTTTVVINANGGTTPYTGTGTFTASSGTHTYLVTDANGCSVTLTVTLTEPGQLVGSSTQGTILCNGGTTTVNITATGGVAPYNGTGTFTASAGTHTYLVTDSNGNSTIVTVVLTQPSQLIASATSGSILCNGGTTTVNVTATGGVGPYTGTGLFTVGAGTYTYLVTDANGCSATTSIVVTEPTPLIASATTGTISGFGGTTTMVINANGGTTPYSGTGTFTASSGTHTYLVADANGCSVTLTVTLTEPGQLVGSATQGTILCNGGTTTVNITATGGVAPYSGVGIFTASAGTHTYLVTDSNGNSTIVTVVLTQPSQLIASATSGSILCNGGTTTVNVTATGGVGPYTGIGSFNVAVGTHTFLVTDANGCSGIASITVTQPAQLLASVTGGNILCNGGTTNVNVTATGGVGPYTGTSLFTVGAGTYTYLVTDANGCSATTSIVVTEPAQLTASPTTGTISGFGGTTTVVINANGGTTPYSGTGTFTASSGTHTYLVTDANDCSVTLTITLTEPGQLVGSSTQGTILCNGGTTIVNITATGGVAPYSGTGTFTASAGTHTYLVTDTNGNSTIVTVVLTQPSQLIAAATSGSILCNGGTTTVNVTATGGVGPYTGSGLFTVGAGTYTYLVTDANGCSTTASIVVTEPAQLAASATTGTISGFGGTTTVVINANGGTTPYSGTGTFTASSGTHTYLVTDANGCSVTLTVTLTEPGQLVGSATQGTILCNGGTTTVNITATGGIAPYSGVGTFTASAGTHTYLVTDTNGNSTIVTVVMTQPSQLIASATSGSILCNGGTTTINVTATGGVGPYSGTGLFTVGAGTYTYLVTDANGCSTTASIIVTEPTPLTASATTGTISGFGGTTTVVINANGGTTPYSGTGTFTASSGTHTYLLTDANGCSVTLTVTLTEPGQLVGSSTQGTIICNGGTTTVNITATGGVAPYSGVGIFTASAGTHTYLVTDSNGNSTIVTVVLTQPSQLIASATSGSILCNGGTTTVNVTATGGVGPYTGIGSFNVAAGTHTFLVTDANGCSGIASITVTEPAQLLASATGGNILCNGGTTAISVTATGGIGPYTGTGSFNVAAGTHTLLVTDANGCSGIASITVTEPAQLLASATGGNILCNGGTTNVNVTATGGIGPYTGTGSFNVAAGTHTFLVTDANGCSGIASITVTQPAQLLASATGGNILCNGGTTNVNVTATGGVGPYTGTGSFNVAAGTHTYLVTDANGCSGIASITVTQPAQLLASATGGNILCNGGTTAINVTATGGVGPYTGTGSFNVAAGTHTYLVTDANGCSGIASITVTDPAQLLASATGGNILCNGGTTNVNVTATGGVGPYTGTGSFNVATGRHTFLVTDANGCSGIASITVTEPAQLLASATGGNILCNGGTTAISVTATGGVGPYTGTGLFTVGAGTYTYLVTDANGCSATASIVVTEPAQLTASATAGTISGFGGTTTVVINANGGTTPYSGTGTFTASVGTHTYLVTDANGCSVTLTVTLTEPGQLVGSSTQGTILCNGGTTTVNITATGGVAPYNGTGTFTASAGTHTYLVTDSNGNSTIVTVELTQPSQLIASATSGSILCNGGTTTVNVTATGGIGPYTGTGLFTVGAGTYTYLVTDANGCSTTASIIVTEPTPLIASATTGTISGFGGTTTVVINANGGTTPYSGTGTFTASSGTHTYLVTDANGCSVTLTVTLTEPGQLVGSATQGTILCNGGTTTVNITATGGVAPYNGTGTFTASAGTHTYLVTDSNGNSTIVTVVLTQPSQLIASATSGSILCNGGTTTVNVTATGGIGPYTGTGLFTVGAGTYTYLVTDANGCSTTASIIVTEPTPLIASATAGTISGFGGTTTVVINANGGTTPYSGTGTFTASSGTHTYLVTDANGCSVTLTVTLTEPGQLVGSSTQGTILCNGGTTTVNITATGGVAPYSGVGIFTASAGTHTYLVTDSNGNSTIVTVVLTQPSQLIASATSGSILCNGGTTTVNVTATGGVGPYTGTGLFTVGAGTYTYLVTDANGCSTTASIIVTEPTPLIASATTGTISGFGGTTTVVINANGGTTPYSGTGTFTASSGTHTYLVTDANGCSVTLTVTLTEPGQLVGSATQGTILCNGGTTTVNITATGGVAPYSGVGIFSASAGTHTYLVTDSNGNSTIVTVVLTQPSQLLASATSGSILCNGGTTTVNVTATGGVGPYTGTGLFTVGAGTYTYLVTDANGCSATTSIVVTEPTQLTASATAGTISGFGGTTTVVISANGGTTPYSGTGTFTASVGTHTYLVTDANGCSVTLTVTLTEPGQLVGSATQGTILCNGGTTTVNITATGGIAPYSGVGIFTASAGTHTYLVTDSNGNSTIVTVVLTQPSQLIASATSGSILCNGGTTTVNVTATGGIGPYTGTGLFTVGAGTYTYLVTDANGCSATTSIVVTEPTQLTASATAGTISGFGGTTTVVINANGGTTPYTGTGTFTASSGTHTYLVTDANGCAVTLTVTLTEPGQLVGSSTQGTILCNGGTTTVNITATGGVAPYSGVGIFTASAGTHTYLVTDSNGNSTIVTVVLTQPSQLIASATSGSILCNGGTTTVNVTATGGVGPYTGIGSFNVAAGTHTFLVTDANGCSGIASITVTEPAQLLASATGGNILCNGGTTAINVTATGGVGPYTGTGSFNVAAGTHTYLVTDANGCSGIASITITQPAQLLASATGGNILCNGGTTNVNVTATGGVGPYTGAGSFNVAAGTHTFLVTDANGCSGIASITVTQPAQVLASATGGNILCNGGTTAVNVTATGGVGPYTGTGSFNVAAGTHTFLVSDANGCSGIASITVTQPAQVLASATGGNILCNGGTTNVNVTATGGVGPYTGTGSFNVAAGTHTFLVTDANGCSGIASITVTQPAQLLASAAGGNILCNGGTTNVNVTAIGGVGPYTGTGSFNVAAGTHTFLVTDANGCSGIASISVTQPAQVLASATGGNILCNGGTTNVNVTATGGVGPYTGTGSFNVAAGTHTFLVTDANSCSGIASITVTQPAQLLASATGGNILCNGGTTNVNVTATGGVGPYTGTGSFNVAAGTHTFLVTDANGCSGIASITVTQPAKLLASATGGNILCNGGTTAVNVTATGGVGPYTGTGSFNVAAGTHTYLVTDANGCSGIASITVTQPAQLLASATGGNILCNGGTTNVNVTATGGVGPYTGAGSFNVAAGTHTFLVTDANGCSGIASITVTQPAQLLASATGGNILCNGGTTNVNVTATGGVGPYTGTGSFNVAAGTHTFLVTDANGCSGIASITITEPAQLLASATGGNILCNGGTTNVNVTATGGVGPYTATGSFNVAAGTHTFLVTDANGCSGIASITITEPAQLLASATGGNILCNGGTTNVNVTATGGVGPYTGTGSFNVAAGTHTFLVTDANGCSGIASITVTEPAQLLASATAGNISCNSGTATVNVTATGGIGPYTGTGVFTAPAGTHYYTVTDVNGCSSTAQVTVLQAVQMIASATSGNILCNGGTTTVNVSAAGGAGPYTGDGIFTVPAGTYNYTVTDVNGCSATTGITVTEPAALVLNANVGNILCNGESTTIDIYGTDGTGPYSGEGTFSVVAGSYNYTITDVNGCSASTLITITEPSVLTANSAISASVLCNGGLATIDVNAAGGTFPYMGEGSYNLPAGSYSFTITDMNGCEASSTVTVTEPSELSIVSQEGTILCNGGTTTVNIVAAGGTAPFSGEGTFSVPAGMNFYAIMDANGCTTSSAITISEPALLEASVVETNAILCNGNLATIDITATGGITPYSGTGILNVPAGSYNYVVTDANGCTSYTTISIVEPTPLIVTANPGPCENGIVSVTITATGGITPYSGETIDQLSAGNYTYQVTDANGCANFVTFNVDTAGCSSARMANLLSGENEPALIYPNPNNGSFNVKFSYDGRGVIVNQAGQAVREVMISEQAETRITGLDAGVYYLVTPKEKVKIVVIYE